MSLKYLGETFDLHTGGVDNIFPHHENEIAQSEAYTGKKFVITWMHCHHLIRDGEKMSKSRGNTLTVKDALAKTANPNALRYLLLSTHYRKQLNFTFEALRQAEAALDRIDEFAGTVKYGVFPEGETQAVGKLVKDAEKKFIAGLSDDLNISVAMTAVFGLIKGANTLISRGKIKTGDARKLAAFIDSVDQVLAVIEPKALADKPKSFKIEVEPGSIELKGSSAALALHEAEGLVITPEQEEKIKQRESARAKKDFALADQIRKELLDQGIILEDSKTGIRIKLAPPGKRPA